MKSPAQTKSQTSRKRKAIDSAHTSKKPRDDESQSLPNQPALLGPHVAIVAELAPKYNVLAASVISSTKIQKRVANAVTHLLAHSEQARIVLLHARPNDVSKLITITEQCKRQLADQGKDWYQYNQLWNTPHDTKKKGMVEETVLEPGSGDAEEEFEAMETRFEKAVQPLAPQRAHMSLRVFLSIAPIPDLKTKSGVTTQSNQQSST